MSQTDSAELLRSTLGGDVDAVSVATIHAQAEGVPFILEEIARTYRGAGLLQQIDGVWTLARGVARLVPSAVRSLIQRRASRLPHDTRAVLAEAAIVGRSFGLEDVAAVRELIGHAGTTASVTELAEALQPAVRAGLLYELPEPAAADYRFAHEQVREYAADMLTPARRRELHRALVDLLTAGAEPVAESLALIAHHALEGGDAQRASRFAIDAARAAVTARAPEEALRLVEHALPSASTPADRVALLTARDEALQMLRRPNERLEGLAELAALAEALDDASLELETMLRRAAALRHAEEFDHASALAGHVRESAAERGDHRSEMAACLELGQAHLGRPVGESYAPSPNDADLDAAEEAFLCARALARGLAEVPVLAAATRELGVITNARIRAWFIDLIRADGMGPLAARLVEGEHLDDVLGELEVAPLIEKATNYFEEAIGWFEELGDRRGLMSSVIAMAYMRFAPDIHFQGSARRIEEIRHLSSQLLALTRESERERAEAQMLYGAHVFASAKGVADLALTRGAEAYDKAHLLGERTLEFLAAGGIAMVAIDLGWEDEAQRWLERAAGAAATAPTPFKARQLALWRGRACAALGDAAGMASHFEHAVGLAGEQGRPAARCEALAQFSLEAARLGATISDTALLDTALRAADDASALCASLPGHPVWGARADAARIRVALARGSTDDAARFARRAFAALAAANVEDLNTDIRVPIALGLLAGGTEEEQHRARDEIRMGMMLVAQRIVDEDVRVRWFHGPVARELGEVVGSIMAPIALVAPAAPGAPATPLAPIAAGAPDPTNSDGREGVDADDARLLRLLVEGRTNQQMAEALGLTEPQLIRRLNEFYTRTGTGSRAQATTFAFRERVI